jgi:circadian clock protein KaiC
MRARKFIGGYHDYKILTGGLKIFPRLVASNENRAETIGGKVASGVTALDNLLEGGLDRGNSTILVGPSGVGKTTVAMQYMQGLMKAGEKTLFVSFDETERNFCRRNKGLGINLEPWLADGRFRFIAANPAEMAPGELTEAIRVAVEDGFTGVVIDSLNGFRHALPEDSFLLLQLHELVVFLNERNIATVLVICQSGLIGDVDSPFDITYLSDAVIVLRYFEINGEVRRALSVMKSRSGAHSINLSEFSIDSSGIKIGAQLVDLAGVLLGSPVQMGEPLSTLQA